MQLPASMRVFERGWLSANNILFIGRDETTLVDTGYVTHAAQTLALVRHALGARGLDRIVNTHLHSDHCGANAMLARSLRLPHRDSRVRGGQGATVGRGCPQLPGHRPAVRAF
jgi:glyoxylase-like metal-dependent hydrolase (beta-lactamase superfamily II)